MLTVCTNCNKVFPEEQGECPCCGIPVPEPPPELKAEEEKLLRDRKVAIEAAEKEDAKKGIAILAGIAMAVVGWIIAAKGSAIGMVMAPIGVALIFVPLLCGSDRDKIHKEHAQKMIELRAKYNDSPEDYERRIHAYINDEKLRIHNSQSSAAPQTHDPAYTIKCPTCGSPNCERISGTAKAVSAAAFGLYGNKRNKQFRCKNCEYMW